MPAGWANAETRAQELLVADGHLGAAVDIGDTHLHIGDRVVAQQQAPELVPTGRPRNGHVLNGSTGTVHRFTGPERTPNVVIDFDGLGPLEVPQAFIEQDIGNRRGGGIAPAYAITSYKAEGQTYDAALGLAGPGAVNREDMYVTLSRGRTDLQIYSIEPNASRERLEAEIVGLPDQRTMTQALRDALQRSGRPDVAERTSVGQFLAGHGVDRRPRRHDRRRCQLDHDYLDRSEVVVVNTSQTVRTEVPPVTSHCS